ncbi:MAG: DUF4175 family protein, partial [Alphaproteobacteria bacterium]|nr:DUF4175 family protein [Alphaproteobacteria bacterium]
LLPVLHPSTNEVAQNNIEGFKQSRNKLTIPAQSQMVVQINNAKTAPSLTLDNKVLDFNLEQLSTESYRLTTNVATAGLYQLEIDEEPIRHWPIRVLADFAPEISLAGPIAYTNRDSLRIPYAAYDDYVIMQVNAQISLSSFPSGSSDETYMSSQNQVEDTPNSQDVIEISLLKSNATRKDIKSRAFVDLTSHPWAGLQVQMKLVAYDALMQKGQSHSQLITLPQKIFTHPVARQIIRLRRQVSATQRPYYFEEAGEFLDLADRSKAYDQKTEIYLGLNIISRRLVAPDLDIIKDDVISFMWDMALYLEEGDIAASMARLRNAEKQLMEAIENGADAQEIERLMNQLEKTMADYLEALANTQPATNSPSEDQGFTQKRDLLSERNIGEMMERLRELLKMGMTDAARDLLAEIQNIMQNLQQADSMDMPEETRQALQMIKDMEKLIQEQQQLMERSFDRAMGRSSGDENNQPPPQANQNNNNDPQSNPDFLENKRKMHPEDLARQRALQKKLQELNKSFRDLLDQNAPPAMEGSDKAMRDAMESLQNGNNHSAASSQGQALEMLKESLSAMEKTIIERFMQANQQAISGETEANGRGRDPFGRKAPNPLSSSNNGDDKVPDGDNLGRAYDIQQELRKRMNDRNRRDQELRYIRRLLDLYK